MSRTSFLTGAAALLLALPALAQTSSTSTTAAKPGAAPSAMSTEEVSAMTCDQMMTKAQSMSTTSTAAGMTMAHNEMKMAQAAKAKGDEGGCKTHMQKAMKDMT